MTISVRASAVSFGRWWTRQSRVSQIARSRTLSATAELAGSFYDDFHTCSGTDRLKASWLFWHACTASVTRGTFVLGFAKGRNALGNPDLSPKLGHLK
jgi:hypothetical protein